jgi:hypothetical protein
LRLLEPAIEKRRELGSTGVFVGILYEARALIALASGNRELYETSAALACEHFCLVEDSAFYVRARRLLEVPRVSMSSHVSSQRPLDGSSATTLTAATLSTAQIPRRSS